MWQDFIFEEEEKVIKSFIYLKRYITRLINCLWVAFNVNWRESFDDLVWRRYLSFVQLLIDKVNLALKKAFIIQDLHWEAPQGWGE